MHLKDHLLQGFLYLSVADAGVWGEEVYRDGSTSCVWLSSSTLPPQLPFFPPKAFPTIFSSLLFPCTTSLQPTTVFTLELLSCPCPAPSHCTFWWTYLGYIGPQHRLHGSHSLRLSQTCCFTLGQTQELPFCPDWLPWGFHPCFGSSTPGCRSIITHSPPLFLCFLYLTNFFMDLYTTFWRSGPPASSQVVFCQIFCIGRSSPDASMARGVLNFHLLLCHRWLSILNIATYTCQSKMSIVSISYKLNL